MFAGSGVKKISNSEVELKIVKMRLHKLFSANLKIREWDKKNLRKNVEADI